MPDRIHAISIPEFGSREEEAEFWDTHDVTDYLDELQPMRVQVVPQISSLESSSSTVRRQLEEEHKPMDQQIVDNNAVSRRRLQALASRLDDASLQQMVDADWTVASVLAHLAFWDQSTYVRWENYARGGELLGISDAVIDIVNAANLPTWLALPGRTTVDLALHVAETVDARIEALTSDAFDQATSQALRFMLERWGHRIEHLDQIEAALD